MNCERCGGEAILIHEPTPEDAGRLYYEWKCVCGERIVEVVTLLNEYALRREWGEHVRLEDFMPGQLKCAGQEEAGNLIADITCQRCGSPPPPSERYSVGANLGGGPYYLVAEERPDERVRCACGAFIEPRFE